MEGSIIGAGSAVACQRHQRDPFSDRCSGRPWTSLMSSVDEPRPVARSKVSTARSKSQGSSEIEPRVHGMPGIATNRTQAASKRHMRVVQPEMSTGSGSKKIESPSIR